MLKLENHKNWTLSRLILCKRKDKTASFDIFTAFYDILEDHNIRTSKNEFLKIFVGTGRPRVDPRVAYFENNLNFINYLILLFYLVIRDMLTRFSRLNLQSKK